MSLHYQGMNIKRLSVANRGCITFSGRTRKSRNLQPHDLPPLNNEEFRQRLVFSDDGTAISYRTIGAGMPLVIIPGSLGMAIDYEEFARQLSGPFTVHVVDRRGRESGIQGDNYSVEKESEDIQAVCTATNATCLFGHSYGGFVALEIAFRDSRFTKIALCEPGLSVDGSINVDWAPQCQAELDQGKYSDALVTFIHGLTPPHAFFLDGYFE